MHAWCSSWFSATETNQLGFEPKVLHQKMPLTTVACMVKSLSYFVGQEAPHTSQPLGIYRPYRRLSLLSSKALDMSFF